MTAIERVLAAIQAEDRTQLYEHEVYALIGLGGAILPPVHEFVPAGSSLDAKRLAAFPGDQVVVKLVSPDVVHKTEADAVLFVGKDPGLVRAAIEQLSVRHSDVRVAGALVIEFIEHDTGVLGEELLVGVRASREFGPVIVAGLGGQATEYLAAKMGPGVAVAKAIASETTAEAFLEAFQRTAAYDVLAGQVRGRTRLVSDDELLRCFDVFLSLAQGFCLYRGDAVPSPLELEVNPFAVRNGHLIPLDGRGSLGKAGVARRARPANRVAGLLEPSSIALTGISAKAGSFGRIILGNVLKAGFDPEHLWIVKPGEQAIDGVRCVPTFAELPEPADLLVIAAPAAAVPSVIDEANASGNVRAGLVISGGTGETPGTEGLGEAIRAAIDKGETVFLGPNCMGVRSIPGRYDTFFIPNDKLSVVDGPVGPVALVSQSGAFIAARLSTLAHLNPAFSISLGNQADTTVSDVLQALAGRDDLTVVGVYLEGFADLDGLETRRAVARWTDAGKTVVFYKAGRTESGRSAAAGHTAAVAGDYDVCVEALEGAGALVANDFREFGLLLETATLMAGRIVRGDRLFALTNAGMEAVGMADAGGSFEPPCGPFARELRTVLASHGLEALVAPRNPLDLTPSVDEDAYDAVVRLALSRDDVDAVIVACVPLAPGLRTLRAQLDDPKAFPQRVAEWLCLSDKPLVFVVDAGALYDPLASNIRAQGIPVFGSADEAVRVLTRWMRSRAALFPSAASTHS